MGREKEVINNKYWTIEKIKNLGFELINSEKMWCHFRGKGFDLFINLNDVESNCNYFNFHSYKSSFNGNFKAVLENEQEFNNLFKYIRWQK